MPHTIGFVDNSGGVLAHYKMLKTIRDFASANGYTINRYDTSTPDHELLMMAPGMSGEEQVFIGLRTYQSQSADYYNLLAGGFTGYVAGNSFDTQPGAWLSGVPAHNNRIDYWLTLNGQRLVLAMKVGTPVYESAYLGKALPYGRPSQYPYPLVCGGMLEGATETRFSDILHSMPFKGNRPNFALRSNDGWLKPHAYPWGNAAIAGEAWERQLRDTGNVYQLLPVELHDNAANVWGALDGVFYISGFNNAVENTLQIGGQTYVVIQDAGRNGFSDYYALRMDS